MARDRPRDDLAAEATQTASAAKATTTFSAGQSRKAAVTHHRRSSRSSREAIRQREGQQRDLITTVSDLGAPVQHELANRLHRCQQARKVRRAWSNNDGAASSAYPHQCRLFACWACRRSIIRRRQEKARQQFAGAANSACTVVSIVLASNTRIDAIRGAVAKARKDLSNMRAAAYQQPGGWRWRSVQAFGIVGIDAVALEDAAPMAPDRSTPIPGFPLVAPADNTLWLQHVHLAVHHPHLDRAELVRAVTHQWPGSQRVSVRPFEEHRSAADNAAAVVGKALERFGDEWPAHSRADFHGWLHGLRRGLQPLALSSRPRREGMPCRGSIKDVTARVEWQDREIEPMPVLV